MPNERSRTKASIILILMTIHGSWNKVKSKRYAFYIFCYLLVAPILLTLQAKFSWTWIFKLKKRHCCQKKTSEVVFATFWKRKFSKNSTEVKFSIFWNKKKSERNLQNALSATLIKVLKNLQELVLFYLFMNENLKGLNSKFFQYFMKKNWREPSPNEF